jgi:quercetin dioxygenase-like cupin family protein
MSRYFPDSTEFGKHTFFERVQVRTIAGDHVQLSLADIPADGVVDWHAHINEQVGMVLSGVALFEIGDEKKELRAGEFFRIPGNVRHRVSPIGGPVKALDVFYPIREEYR